VPRAFPSACGKTNFAMLIPPKGFEGWKVTTIGDDIAWISRMQTGRLLRDQPRAGYFGVAPGTSNESNRTRCRCSRANVIFTNVALTDDGDVWWEGMTKQPPAHLSDWGRPVVDARLRAQGRTPERAIQPCRRGNARRSIRTGTNPNGVPIDASSSARAAATRYRSSSRRGPGRKGVYKAATMGSETTAGGTGKVGEVRRDPFAMLPFCGYHVGDYFAHWLRWASSRAAAAHLQRELVPHRRERQVRVAGLRPEHARARVDRRRCHGRAPRDRNGARVRAAYGDLNWAGLDFTPDRYEQVMRVDECDVEAELAAHDALFAKLGTKQPPALHRRAVAAGVTDSACEDDAGALARAIVASDKRNNCL
jgi:phosphoenolpyruvate carboxykinase (GTP)